MTPRILMMNSECMVNFIAIENAANGASVALLQSKNGEKHINYLASEQEGKNAEQVLPMLDELLQQAQLGKQDIDGVVFSQGPGGFTGLRVACGLAQGMALGLDIPIIPVSSLEASAVQSLSHLEDGLMVVALDARMQEVYLAVYQVKRGKLLPQAVLSPVLMQASDVMAWIQEQLPRWCLWRGLHPHTVALCLVGNAVSEYPEAFALPNSQWVLGNTAWANADVLVDIGFERFQKEGACPIEQAAPLYLRDKVAFTTVERESGLGGNPKIALPSLTQEEQQQAAFAKALLAQNYWIRALQMSDLPAVMAIEQEAHYTPWSEGMFMAALMHIHYHSWALVNDKQEIIAYAVQLIDPDVVNLMTIAVAPALQGQGLGRLLLQGLELFILSRPTAPYVQLLEVRASNVAARTLYEHMGYEQIGLRKGYYASEQGREDALVLQKTLKSMD